MTEASSHIVAWLTPGGDVTRSHAYAVEQSANEPEAYPKGLVFASNGWWGWLSVESAPKSGDDLIMHDAATGTSHVSWWTGYKWHDPDEHYYSESPAFRPTHWMPLAKPPVSQSADPSTCGTEPKAQSPQTTPKGADRG